MFIFLGEGGIVCAMSVQCNTVLLPAWLGAINTSPGNEPATSDPELGRRARANRQLRLLQSVHQLTLKLHFEC